MIHWKHEGCFPRQGLNINARSNSKGMAITVTFHIFKWSFRRTWKSWNGQS